MTLKEKLAELGLTVEPLFNQGTVRRGAEWFVGRSFQVREASGAGEVPVTYQVAWFGDFRDKKKSGEWRSHTEIPEGDREEVEKQVQAALAEERAERLKFQEIVALEAESLWEQATDRGNHPYIDEKKLAQLHGARIMMNDQGHPVLLVPMRDVDGKLWNLTRIYSKKFEDPKSGESRGNKFLLKGGKKEGLYHALPGDLKTLYLCEGFATGASIKEALGDSAAVAICFDAGNLPRVAAALRKKLPEAQIVLCADNDQWKPQYGNAGVEKASEAAELVQGKVVAPRFKNTKSKPTDFNDLRCLEGLPEVANQILSPTDVVLPPEGQAQRELAERRMVAELLEGYQGCLIKQDQDVFEFKADLGLWHHYPPREARDHFMRLIDASYGRTMRFKDLQSVYNRFLMQVPYAPRGVNLFAPPPHVTNFKNGALELVPQPDGTYHLNFRAKNKLDYLCYSHPFDYVEDAPLNQEFEETVGRVLGQGESDRVNAYYELLGACLLPAFPKVSLFVGPPGSGKSTLILFAYQLIDPALRSHVDPSDWRGFSMETMAGKLVNLSPDIALSRPIAENILKQIEDRVPMRIQRKGITDIYGPLPAVHLFGANGLPRTAENVDAFTRRVLIFRCDKYKAPETGFIRNFAQHVWAKNPQGVITRAIQGLQRLAANRGHFTLFEEAKQEMEQWKSDTADYVQQFLSELRGGSVVLADSESKASLAEKGQLTRAATLKTFHSWFEVAAPRRTPPDAKEVYRRLRELGIQEKMIKGVRYFALCQVHECGESSF